MASPSADDLEQTLLSFEKLDRSSPDLWPEKIPGVSEFVASHSPLSEHCTPPKWLQDIDEDDINMLQEFGSLTPAGLIDKVKQLQNLAYQLGLEEAREMTRGKFLNILNKGRVKKK
ncbi:PREDICTED: protein lin-52 homolog isoform X2 [Priapulus caudatus]|uniref:Protein lin-52 homolog isoform X2 n=1 Tax=Priapulus caudatus TaxID=37621 RepID=A0ABM1DSQ5_PRICU|nr:PREDICTED: protein lin-52 homolog isoform X2 [Priapulus caudatus]